MTSTPPKWRLERTRRLCRIFRRVEQRIADGGSLAKAMVWFAARWKHKHYKSDPTRPVRFGKNTLVRLYYQWKAGGRTRESLTPHFRCPRQRIKPDHTQELANLCLEPGVPSFSAAYRRLACPMGTASAYHYAMPPAIRKPLGTLLAGRRNVAALERAARRAVLESGTPQP